jgi:hypothetical protein
MANANDDVASRGEPVNRRTASILTPLQSRLRLDGLKHRELVLDMLGCDGVVED